MTMRAFAASKVGAVKPFTAASKPQRAQKRCPPRAVALAEPEVSDAEVKDMYKQFARLLRTSTPTFNPGDKVGRACRRAEHRQAPARRVWCLWCPRGGAGGPAPPRAAAPPAVHNITHKSPWLTGGTGGGHRVQGGPEGRVCGRGWQDHRLLRKGGAVPGAH